MYIIRLSAKDRRVGKSGILVGFCLFKGFVDTEKYNPLYYY